MTDDDTLYCSFCGKSQHDVKKLIAGPTVFICDECVALCATIVVAEEKHALWFIARERPLDSKAMIKEIVRELREEAAEQVPA